MQTAADLYLASVKSICPNLTEEELAYFAAKLTVKELKKRAYFVEADKIQKEIGFITSGLIRSFFVDRAGDEITVGFYAEGDYATHYPAFITRRPSRYSIQCLEPSTIACLSFDDMQLIYKASTKFERYGRLVAEEILKQQQARIEGFIFQTAEERYLDFVEQHPTLFNRISLSHLCSFLGIERQSLTRIRQKLLHK